MHDNKEEFFNNIINSDDIDDTVILPETSFGKIKHSKGDSVYYYVSCYDENFEFFKMEMISPMMHNKQHIEDVYNEDPELTDYIIKHYIRRPKIPWRIRKKINRGEIKLILFHGLEGYHSVNFNYISRLLQVDKKHIVYITGDYRYSTPELSDDGVITLWCNYWERNCAYIANDSKDMFEKQISSYQENKKRQYLNTFYNRRIRDHRINIMSVMNKEKLLDKMIWSWGGLVDNNADMVEMFSDPSYVEHCFVRLTGDEYRESIYDVLKWGNLQNGKPAVEDLQINLVNTMNEDHIFNTYYQLICETWATNRSLFLSEKSFKPFALGQSFLSWSDCGTVNALRELGYDVFDDIFDHSYDSIKDDKRRLLSLRDQVKATNKKGVDKFSKITKNKNFINRVMQNNENLKNSYSRNGIDFKYLENRK